jgi:hypothetical protein
MAPATTPGPMAKGLDPHDGAVPRPGLRLAKTAQKLEG